MIDETYLKNKINSIEILSKVFSDLTAQANMINRALRSIALVDGKLPIDKLTGVQITEEWKQKIYDDCIPKITKLSLYGYIEPNPNALPQSDSPVEPDPEPAP